MIMWRVENEEGDGPYNCSIRDAWRFKDHTRATGRPTPEEDPELAVQIAKKWGDRWSMPSTCIFGFKTLKQYKAWFSKGERQRLKKLGYKLVKMKVESMIWSKYQAITEERIDE